MAGHSDQRRMYGSMRKKIFWPHMLNDAYTIVSSCSTCKRYGTATKLKRQLQMFFASNPPKIVTIDILESLLRTDMGNQYAIFMRDRYSKLARAVPTGKKASSYVSDVLFNSWVVPYAIPTSFLVDNLLHFVSKLFETLCTMLTAKHSKTSAYHPQTSGKVKRYNCTIVTQRRH